MQIQEASSLYPFSFSSPFLLPSLPLSYLPTVFPEQLLHIRRSSMSQDCYSKENG